MTAFTGGHQSLIQKINSYKSHHMTSVVLTFNYNPACRLKGQNPVLIYTSLERRIIASRLGEWMFSLSTPLQMRRRTWRRKILYRKCLSAAWEPRHIVVGEDFHFWQGTQGRWRPSYRDEPASGLQRPHLPQNPHQSFQRVFSVTIRRSRQM